MAALKFPVGSALITDRIVRGHSGVWVEGISLDPQSRSWDAVNLLMWEENGFTGRYNFNMLTPEQTQRITRALPLLQRADPQLMKEFQQAAFFTKIPAGKDVFVEGDRANTIALLLSGEVRVYKIGETGREITLYRFGFGGSCVLTANAILSQQSFPAIATVVHDAEAVMILADTFRKWVNRYELWRDFVFELMSQRLLSVMEIVDEVAFRRLDTRIAALLLARARLQNPIRITHQEIAAELGSSREVISRMLEEFGKQGLIQAARGVVEVLDVVRLENRAGM